MKKDVLVGMSLTEAIAEFERRGLEAFWEPYSDDEEEGYEYGTLASKKSYYTDRFEAELEEGKVIFFSWQHWD